jgi:uncharacterized OsmC-like protein
MHATWEKDAGTVVATTPVGGTIAMAVNDELAASGTVPGPLEVFVAGLAGCTVHEILENMVRKDHVELKDVQVTIEGVRRPTPPTLFDTVHVTFTLTGTIDDGYAGEVIREIMTRRCPVATSFGRASYLTWEHRIVPG